LYQILYKGP